MLDAGQRDLRRKGEKDVRLHRVEEQAGHEERPESKHNSQLHEMCLLRKRMEAGKQSQMR